MDDHDFALEYGLVWVDHVVVCLPTDEGEQHTADEHEDSLILNLPLLCSLQ